MPDIVSNLIEYVKCEDQNPDTTITATVGNNGVLVNANTEDISVSGPGGNLLYAYDLNGTTQYIKGTLPSALTYPVTMSTWFRIDVTQVNSTISINSTTSNLIYLFAAVNASSIFTQERKNTTLDGSSTGVTCSPSTGAWKLISIVYPDANGVKIYVDGVKIWESLGRATTVPLTGVDGFTLGILRQISGFYYMNGAVTGGRVYSGRELVADDMVALYDDAKPQNSVLPAVSGTLSVGNTLTSSSGVWSDGSFAYQWYRYIDNSGTDPVAISGATSSTYVIANHLGGYYLRCRVTATNGIGSTAVYTNYELVTGTQVPDVTTNLVAHYILDDHDTSADVVATVGSNGTLVGGNNTDDIKVGLGNGPGGLLLDAGLALDGTADKINITSLASSLSDTASFSAWLKLDVATPAATAQCGFVQLGESTAGGLSLYPFTNSLGYISTFRGTSSGATSRVDAITLPAGVNRTGWHLVTVTTTPGTNGWKLYVNGSLVTQTTGITGIYYGGSVWSLGHNNFNNSTLIYLDGALADARIYNRVLTVDNITALHGQGKPQSSVLPTTSGTSKVGDTLTGDPGTWTDGSQVLQWMVASDSSGTGASAIVGETGTDYDIDQDIGDWIAFRVTRTNGIGSTVETSDYVEVLPATLDEFDYVSARSVYVGSTSTCDGGVSGATVEAAISALVVDPELSLFDWSGVSICSEMHEETDKYDNDLPVTLLSGAYGIASDHFAPAVGKKVYFRKPNGDPVYYTVHSRGTVGNFLGNFYTWIRFTTTPDASLKRYKIAENIPANSIGALIFRQNMDFRLGRITISGSPNNNITIIIPSFWGGIPFNSGSGRPVFCLNSAGDDLILVGILRSINTNQILYPYNEATDMTTWMRSYQTITGVTLETETLTSPFVLNTTGRYHFPVRSRVR